MRSSQNRWRFSRAAMHLGVRPATYSLSRHRSSISGVGLSSVDCSALRLMSLVPLSIAIGPATPGHLRPVLRQLILLVPCLCDGLVQVVLHGLQLGAEGGDLGPQGPAPPLEFAALPPELSLLCQRRVPLLGLLGEPGRAS